MLHAGHAVMLFLVIICLHPLIRVLLGTLLPCTPPSLLSHSTDLVMVAQHLFSSCFLPLEAPGASPNWSQFHLGSTRELHNALFLVSRNSRG